MGKQVARYEKVRGTFDNIKRSRQDAGRLDGSAHKTKPSTFFALRKCWEMKKVADASEPPVVIPVVVVAIDVHVALVVIPPVEGEPIV